MHQQRTIGRHRLGDTRERLSGHRAVERQHPPIGGIVDDPHLLALKGQKAFKATRVATGHYECAAFTGGRLEVRPSLEFTIVDKGNYRDAFGGHGTYAFDASSGAMAFRGGALDGQRGYYKQASDPPVKTQPPEFNFDVSHDTCTMAMR